MARRERARIAGPFSVMPGGEGWFGDCIGGWAFLAHPWSGGSEAVAFFLAGVGVVVVAVAPPEAEPVGRRELDLAQPLRALPEVLPGDEGAGRPAVLGRQGLAVGARREERLV